MNLTTEVSFGKNHACIAHFEYNHCMGGIIYPQDITDFYILKLKLCVHPGRQSTKCSIAEYESESYTAHSDDIRPPKGSALPTIISLCIRIRLIVSPCRPLLVRLLVLQGNHGRIDLRRGGNCIVAWNQLGYRCFRNSIRLRRNDFLPCVYRRHG